MNSSLIVAIVIAQVVMAGVFVFLSFSMLKRVFKEQQSQLPARQEVSQEIIDRARQKQKNGLFVICLIFGVVGIGLSGFGVNNLVNAHQSASWPTTEGKILTSDVNKSTTRETAGSGIGSGPRTTTSYAAAISYEYSVNGELFFSDKVSFGEMGGAAVHAYAKTRDYPKGKRVSVFYNPDNPRIAVLEPGGAKSAYLLLIMGIIFIVLPFAIYKIVVKCLDMGMSKSVSSEPPRI